MHVEDLPSWVKGFSSQADIAKSTSSALSRIVSSETPRRGANEQSQFAIGYTGSVAAHGHENTTEARIIVTCIEVDPLASKKYLILCAKSHGPLYG